MLSPKKFPKAKVGDRYVCTGPSSCAYKMGSVYIITNNKGKMGFIGDDGFFDPLDMIVSEFKPYKEDKRLKSV